MAQVNYLGYAQMMGQRNPTAEGLATLGQSLDTMQAADRQRKMDAMTMEQNKRAGSLADLQMQTGQAALAKGQAEQGALADLYGTTGQPDAYAKALSFQAQEQKDMAKKKAMTEENANRFKTFTDTFKSFADAVHNDVMDADAANKAFPGLMKHLGLDYSQAGVSFTFGKGGGYYSGPIKETDLIRINGKEVPYGSSGIVEKARVVGMAPDGKTPIYEIAKDTTFKEAAADKKETWSEPYETTVGGKRVMLQKSSTGQIKPVVQDVSTTVKIDTGGGKKPKPMPPAALKMQQEALDAIGTASNISTDLNAVKSLVDSGKLDLGMFSNAIGSGLNYAGLSTENSRNLATFKATLEKLRNDSLRLNKGVQTEGDAQRAWNELLANINDNKLVSKRLEEIQNINNRAATLHEMNVENIRNNYSLPTLDTTGYKTQPAAIGKGSSKPSPKAKGGKPPLDSFFK